ncbi:MAG: hypothetical protein AAF591_22890 [Verrucomicrobiota bacterium]
MSDEKLIVKNRARPVVQRPEEQPAMTQLMGSVRKALVESAQELIPWVPNYLKKNRLENEKAELENRKTELEIEKLELENRKSKAALVVEQAIEIEARVEPVDTDLETAQREFVEALKALKRAGGNVNISEVPLKEELEALLEAPDADKQ